MTRAAVTRPGRWIGEKAGSGRQGCDDVKHRDDARGPTGNGSSCPDAGAGLSLAVADVGWSTTENLFREIDRESVAVLMLKCLDYVNGWRRGLYPWSPSCRLRRSGPAAWEQQFVLPSGWMKRYPRLGMRPIARSIRSWWERSRRTWRRGLVMLYPHYLYLRDQLRPDVSIYYNIDDYALYWPRAGGPDPRAGAGDGAVGRPDGLRLAAAGRGAARRRCRKPPARIHHIPHGAPTPFLAAQPAGPAGGAAADIAHLPRPLLGYVGSMEDRVDWELMDRLSREFPARLDRRGGPDRAAGRRSLVGRVRAGSWRAPTSTPSAGARRRPCRATTRRSTSR